MAIASIGGILGFESALGIAGGHHDAKALVNWCLSRLEPDDGVAEPSLGAAVQPID